MFDLEPVLARARPAIDRNLAAMFAARQYITGPQLAAFESQLAAAFGARAAVGAGTGTAAIELCLREAGVVRADQEVVVPALTSLFTAQAVLAAGARLRIADVDPDTLLLSPAEAERAWGPRVAAVICVHLYGHPCRLRELAAICGLGGVPLIQDACQAHGATAEGQPLTHYSPYAALSFYPTKNLGCLGDGGAVVTSSARVARRILALRDGGRRGDQISRAPAINSRLDEMHACYLSAFLEHLSAWTEHRRTIASIYDGALRECPGIRLLPHEPGAVHHLYVIRTRRRDELRQALAAKGIATGIHYPIPLHRQPAFRRVAEWKGRLPHAEAACREILSLPIGPHVTEDQARRIAVEVRAWRPA